ncbi:MAG: response regulator [Pirellulales bacterium]
MKTTEHRFDDLIVVDPQFDDYEPLFEELGLSELRVKQFSTGEDALRATDRCSSTLWLMNIELPDMPGTGLLTLVRRRWRRCSVFLVGNAYSAEDELAARLAGATAYVCKPACAEWLEGCWRRIRSPAIRAGPVPFS